MEKAKVILQDILSSLEADHKVSEIRIWIGRYIWFYRC